MGKGAGTIRNQFQTRLAQIARELGREVDPEGLPRGTKFSELEAVAGALGDEMARQLIEINVQEQADDWPEDELGECPLCGGIGHYKRLSMFQAYTDKVITSNRRSRTPVSLSR